MTHSHAAILGCVATAAVAVAAWQQPDKVSVASMPPSVVKTVPQSGDTQVDASKVKEIRVTFTKLTLDKSWSWSRIAAETLPRAAGDIRYEADIRTCVLPVALEPGRTYVLWLNSEKFHGFQDADGHAAVPYLLVFETKP